jgi:D-glycero-alpha-D-manno-heptose-7-phosphate kinase
MIISRTPVRVSFFGGGTDYREYYERNGGAVLGTTINKYVYVSLNRLSNFFDYKIRVGYSKAELVNHVDEIVHPSVRECLRFKNVNGNLDIHIFADLPARTGLGSSSSFTVGFLHALYALEGKIVSKEQLAKDSLTVEQERLRENVGSQDQIHAAYGGLNVIEFSQSRFRVQPLVIAEERRHLLEAAMMVFFTGQTRYATDVVREQIERTRTKCNDTYLKEMHAMVGTAVQVVTCESRNSMLGSFGRLMHESWALKKSLSSSVSNSAIDEAYERALAAGAYGGKISGAGGGGFLTLIVDPSRQDAVREALNGHLEVTFKFEDEGSSIIYLKP